MKKAMPIFRRELSAYFNSLMAYIVISVFLLLTGWFFTSELFLSDDSSLRNVFSIIPFIFIKVIDILYYSVLTQIKILNLLNL